MFLLFFNKLKDLSMLQISIRIGEKEISYDKIKYSRKYFLNFCQYIKMELI